MEIFQSLYTCQALFPKYQREHTKDNFDKGSFTDDSLILHSGFCHCQRIKFTIRATNLILCAKIPSIFRFHQAIPLSPDRFELLSHESTVTHYDFHTTDQTNCDNNLDEFYAFCGFCGQNILYSPKYQPSEIFVNLECISKDNIKQVMPLEPEKLLEINSNLINQMELLCMAGEALSAWKSILSKYLYNAFDIAKLSMISLSQLYQRFNKKFTRTTACSPESSDIELVVIFEKRDSQILGSKPEEIYKSITDRTQLFNKWLRALLGDGANDLNGYDNRSDNRKVLLNIETQSNNMASSNVTPQKSFGHDESQSPNFTNKVDSPYGSSSGIVDYDPMDHLTHPSFHGNGNDWSDNSNHIFKAQDTCRSLDKDHFSIQNPDVTVVDCTDSDSLSLLSSSDTSDSSKSQIFRSEESSPIYLHNQLKEHLSRHLRTRTRSK
mmetsp:Transcript_4482/g.4636  ORF Transcript_4482/g.4636 Transcript_4482/m.4636 type:complete len:437 (+) Transcript_4482:90-1400(+)